MTKSIEALIKPNLLIWARECSHIPLEVVAKRMGVPEEKIRLWEAGTTRPTVRQAKDLAHIYKQPFAAFYLPQPPTLSKLPVQDYRRLSSGKPSVISPDLAFEIRRAIDRREIVLEIQEGESESVPPFTISINPIEDVEEIGLFARKQLGILFKDQKSWHQQYEAFNKWKEAIENLNILVFQTEDVNINEMRGFSIYFETLPLIVVNRKDAYVGRIFSLLHEFSHLLLRTSGLCDMEPDASLTAEAQQLEIFCNQVAAASLIPANEFLNNEIVQRIGSSRNWTDTDIRDLSSQFGVSREAIVRRLLTFQFVTNEFYNIKRLQYAEERKQRKPKKGFVPPDVNAISVSGKPFVRHVLGAYYAGRITSGDVSDYLNVKSKHFKNIWESVGV